MFEWYEGEVRELERRRQANPPPSGVVAFYGSSSVRLWTTLADDFCEVPVVNLGFGGSTLAACAYYFARLVPPVNPRALVCYAGENDLGDGASVDAVVQAFRDLHVQVGDRLGETPFAYLSVKPSPARWNVVGRIQEVNRRIAEEIKVRPQSHFVDVYTPMQNDDGSPRRDLWTEDGIHMSAAGYYVWWQVLSAHRRQLGF